MALNFTLATVRQRKGAGNFGAWKLESHYKLSYGYYQAHLEVLYFLFSSFLFGGVSNFLEISWEKLD